MGQLKDKVGTGVIAGEKLNELFAYAKEKQFALPAVNVTSSSSINAVIETAVKVNSPVIVQFSNCLLYTSPSPRDAHESRMPSSA